MSHPSFFQRGRKRAIDGVNGSLVREIQQKREKQEHLTRSNAPVFPVFAGEKIFLQFFKFGDDPSLTLKYAYSRIPRGGRGRTRGLITGRSFLPRGRRWRTR